MHAVFESVPGVRCPDDAGELTVLDLAKLALAVGDAPVDRQQLIGLQVRKTPSWSRSWAKFSLF